MIKIILLLFAAAVIGLADTSKEPILYIGHAMIESKTERWCVIRPVYAINKKEADSLFRPLCDSLEKYYHGSVQKITYDVWKVEPKMILKIEKD